MYLNMIWYLMSNYIMMTGVLATPPACFLSCINEMAQFCVGGHTDIKCLCGDQDSILGCLVDICPYGTFEAARDHYFGTCLEHGQPTNGRYPPGYLPPHNTTKPIKTKTWTITRPSSTEPGSPANTIPSDSSDTASGSDTDCDDEDWGYEKTVWEEEESVDSQGRTVIIRKPVSVPEKYLQPPYTDPKRRKLIILVPIQVDEASSIYSGQKQNTKKQNIKKQGRTSYARSAH
ncbi:hypothetical protein CANTEDRAFT_113633 [Yamadazyma tenuis ATCC 10573]|uniref:CFEM domain-containing protein n=1 Tax=Candida tenuis (strain ATCC 10573 / BCRC 21748 / CBS 615 / JCM 9827 / NBRC 10315 / NRRL Y-1498 / VKM Y-70) TaxID=590646 RepID=G3B134_CANTC|nr:uncharacterized protein CANTEDRAFT_113633 [Yamadazyma tenuis ATCC 10573]XP_006685965.1 uncharacterized protein CANTEDRAFT_113633 [Yamadazyma tenuis ATCC 10573]EGV65158.1 hypothetical protein CANTEDRAFT_113633 [Yamadazyma tenuis ATCC 10573]EGV65159.1 hypothetical protein CANTEDRAFT_113633 [Yamadazyma tenuis ATCC 10573]